MNDFKFKLNQIVYIFGEVEVTIIHRFIRSINSTPYYIVDLGDECNYFYTSKSNHRLFISKVVCDENSLSLEPKE